MKVPLQDYKEGQTIKALGHASIALPQCIIYDYKYEDRA